MTNLQLVQYLLGDHADVSEERLRIALELADINPDAEYSKGDNCKLYGIAISEISGYSGVKSETEGGYSVTYYDADKGAIIKDLAVRSGCKLLIDQYSSQPKVRNKTYMW